MFDENKLMELLQRNSERCELLRQQDKALETLTDLKKQLSILEDDQKSYNTTYQRRNLDDSIKEYKKRYDYLVTMLDGMK